MGMARTEAASSTPTSTRRKNRSSPASTLPAGDLDVDPLVLRRDQVGLGDGGKLEEPRTYLLDDLLHLRRGKPVLDAHEGVDRGVNVAELVVEERAAHAFRQRAAHVAHLLPRLVPGVRHLAR